MDTPPELPSDIGLAWRKTIDRSRSLVGSGGNSSMSTLGAGDSPRGASAHTVFSDFACEENLGGVRSWSMGSTRRLRLDGYTPARFNKESWGLFRWCVLGRVPDLLEVAVNRGLKRRGLVAAVFPRVLRRVIAEYAPVYLELGRVEFMAVLVVVLGLSSSSSSSSLLS